MEERVKQAEESKVKGNEEFKAQNYLKAKEYYTKAIGKQPGGQTMLILIELCPEEYIYYGNRSACNLSLEWYLRFIS